MSEFRRAHHRVIAKILRSFNADLLLRSECFFAGGTRIALELGEFRESRDIDFLCASRSGFRALRESITQESLGTLLRHSIRLAREVRTDRDGIRTFFDVDSVKVKFEIVLEGRIDLTGKLDRRLGVPVLDLDHTIAEKLLANADRGLDESTHGRDLVDLGFLAAQVGKRGFAAGLAIARSAYGAAIVAELQRSLTAWSTHRARSADHIRVLGISDVERLRRGLRVLRVLARGARG